MMQIVHYRSPHHVDCPLHITTSCRLSPTHHQIMQIAPNTFQLHADCPLHITASCRLSPIHHHIMQIVPYRSPHHTDCPQHIPTSCRLYPTHHTLPLDADCPLHFTTSCRLSPTHHQIMQIVSYTFSEIKPACIQRNFNISQRSLLQAPLQDNQFIFRQTKNHTEDMIKNHSNKVKIQGLPKQILPVDIKTLGNNQPEHTTSTNVTQRRHKCDMLPTSWNDSYP